jgi:acyl-coenzyme A thioesterase PaaI-like protein
VGAPPEVRLLRLWARFAPVPGGRWLFSRLLGLVIPYSGTVRPRIERLAPGDARLVIRDRRGVRNHLRSVHAVALANAGELVSGLAMTAALPSSVRGIVTRLDTEYYKKARGTLVATSSARPPASVLEPVTHAVHGDIHDGEGDLVARTTVHWLLSPR